MKSRRFVSFPVVASWLAGVVMSVCAAAAQAQTVSIQSADVQSYFAADSESLPTSQQSDPAVLAPWAPPSGLGPYTITGPAGVPALPIVPPIPAAIGPANSFAVAPWTSQFADLPTNTLSKSVIWANAPPGTNVADGHVGVNMRLENPTTTYAFHQMNFSVDYTANAPLGGGIAGLPTFFVSGTTTGVNSYAEFGASIDYYWTDINTAGIVGTTTPLGSVSYYWSLIGPGSAFLAPVLPTGALAATPVGATSGLLSIVGKAFVAGDPAVIEVSPIPEPATYVMALAGLACGGLSLWRRRKRTSRHGAAMIPARGERGMKQTVLCLGMFLGAASAQALPLVETLNTNMTRFLVNAATNAESPIPNSPFQSDSLARSAAGTLYSADASGFIWDVTGPFQIPVGPTGRTQIGDLVTGVNGLWGFSNASQELFFFDLGSLGVTYGQVITGLGGSTVTGVAYEPSMGDVYLSGYTGFNADTLYRVANSSTAATTVGAMANGDAGSYFSDLEFDASGTLYAMSWYNRWFYTVSTVNGATTLLSAGPHRDVTAMALTVPEPSTLGLAGAGLAAAGMPGARRRWSGRRGSPTAA